MRIAITMRSFEADCAKAADAVRGDTPADCFAEVQVDPGARASAPVDADETVQVTVVLRGKRGELEDPALGMTNLLLAALRSEQTSNTNAARQVIDAMGIAIETAC